MLLKTKRTICYKCMRCNEYVTAEISAFDLHNGGGIVCECGAKEMLMKQEQKRFVFRFMCAHCGRPHEKSIDMRDFWSKQQVLITCDDCGCVVCSIGDGEQSHVLKSADECYENDKALTQTVTAIQELASAGRVHCECGNKRINIKLGFRGIDLSCKKCGARKFIKACTNEDLAKNQKMKKISLVKNVGKVLQFS